MQSTAPSSTTIVVASQAELDQAYRSLASGEGGTILLAEGTIYNLTANDWNNSGTDASVTIRSADPDNPATLSHLDIRGRENLTIEEVKFHAEIGDLTEYQQMLEIENCRNITIRNCDLSSVADGPRGTTGDVETGVSLGVIRGSETVAFSDNTVTGFNHGLTLRDTYDTTVTGNDISGLQGDCIRFAGASGATIENNHFHDLFGSTWDVNHPDIIQFWGTNISVNNENITIRENFLDTGNGAAYQMIFGHNEHYETNGLLFDQILIEHNVLFGAHQHMISLSDTNGAVVRNNTAIYNPDAYFVNPDGSTGQSEMAGVIQINGVGAVVENNIAHAVINDGNNAVLDVTGRDNNYADHFTNVEAGGSGDLRDLTLNPDSALNGVMGSHLTWFSETVEELMAVAEISMADDNHSLATLDGSLSRGPGGYATDANATFTWTFEDGSTQTGRTINHDFGTSGAHTYTLTVTHQDGTTDTITRTIEVEPIVFLDLTVGADGIVDQSSAGTELNHLGTVTTSAGWFQIGGRDRIEVARETDSLFDLVGFNYEMTVLLDGAASGVLVHQHGTLLVEIDEAGNVTLSLTTDQGSFSVATTTSVFADNGAHHLNFVYDNNAETLSIYVDGQLAGAAEARGVTAAQQFTGLTIGHTWQDGIDASIQNLRLAQEAASAEQVEAYYQYLQSAQLDPETRTLAFGTVEAYSENLEFILENDADFSADGVNIAENNITITDANGTLFDAESFEIRFDLRAAEADASGSVLYLHKVLSVTLSDAGRLVFNLQTDQGEKQIATVETDLSDGDLHRVTLSYDSNTQAMQILIDGTLVGWGSLSGQTSSQEYWDLVFGHPWEDSEANVVIDNISISGVPEMVDPEEFLDTAIASTSTILCLDFDQANVFDSSLYGTSVEIGRGNLDYAEREGSSGLAVSIDSGEKISVTRSYDKLYEMDQFLFDFDVQSDTADGKNVFGIHGSMKLSIEGDDFVFTMTTSDGVFEMESTGDITADRDWHNVQIGYDSDFGMMQMIVDGVVVAQSEASGTTLEKQFWGLELGSSWGRGFDGSIDDFQLSNEIDPAFFVI